MTQPFLGYEEGLLARIAELEDRLRKAEAVCEAADKVDSASRRIGYLVDERCSDDNIAREAVRVEIFAVRDLGAALAAWRQSRTPPFGRDKEGT